MHTAELTGSPAEIEAAEDHRYAAMLAADISTLADLLSESLIYVHTTGDTDTRQSYLDAVQTGFVEYHAPTR